jgi:hypothetical protein
MRNSKNGAMRYLSPKLSLIQVRFAVERPGSAAAQPEFGFISLKG